MRSKEFAHDYRYFPDPDLLPLAVDEKWIDEVRASLPELPAAREDRFVAEYGLPRYDAQVLTGRRDVADYFEAAVKIHRNPKAISNWVMGDLFRVIKERKLDDALRIAEWPVPAAHLAAMIKMIDEGKISGKIAKTLFSEMLASGAPPEAIVREKGLEQVSDTASIEAAIDQVLAANAKAVADYRGGNEKSFGFFVGQVMKATQGKASPQLVNELLKKKLRA